MPLLFFTFRKGFLDLRPPSSPKLLSYKESYSSKSPSSESIEDKTLLFDALGRMNSSYHLNKSYFSKSCSNFSTAALDVTDLFAFIQPSFFFSVSFFRFLNMFFFAWFPRKWNEVFSIMIVTYANYKVYMSFELKNMKEYDSSIWQ